MRDLRRGSGFGFRTLGAAIFIWLAIFLVPGGLVAQSVIGAKGLGTPIGAPDGRTAALGNLGIGLMGTGVSPTDPTSAVDLLLPTVTVSMQPTWGDFTLRDGESQSVRGTRFPLIGIGYPVDALGGAVSVTLGGFLEQRWGVQTPGFVDLGGSEVRSEDRFLSEGGISHARFGWSQRMGAKLAVGATVGSYVGSLEQGFLRALDSLEVRGGETFTESSKWRYQGKTVGLGVRYDPSALVRVSGALEFSGDLTVAPQEGTTGERSAVSIPARFSVGATGRLTPRLVLNGSLVYQDWSGAGGLVAGVAGNQSLSFGGGVEWDAIIGTTRALPLRMGYRRVSLPFRFDGSDSVESSYSAGIGLNMSQTAGVRFGWIDLAVERGTRNSGVLSESFWRGTFSVGISRF